MPLEITATQATDKTARKTVEPLAKRLRSRQQPGMRERIFFTEQLSLLLETGTPLHTALAAISSQVDNPAMRAIIDGLAEEVTDGKTFSYALALYPEMFPVTYNSQDGCNTTTTTLTDEELETFINYHHEQYPVQEVQFNFRREEPIVVNSELSSLAQLWAASAGPGCARTCRVTTTSFSGTLRPPSGLLSSKLVSGRGRAQDKVPSRKRSPRRSGTGTRLSNSALASRCPAKRRRTPPSAIQAASAVRSCSLICALSVSTIADRSRSISEGMSPLTMSAL